MKVSLELTQVELGLIAGLVGVTEGEALQPLFNKMKAMLDDEGWVTYEEMVHEAYKCLDTDINEDYVLTKI